ncbi:protein N-lysine methyltransferase METTL21A-like [Mytilus galloprovincialis]|uniref:protein N-lysine methyltransferase METTL21A-like n=1 Tax=Mytilus galloprovincialis TaxID=29158 RepID=UPI003F7B4CD4
MWFLFHFSRQKLIALITVLTLHFTDCFDTETCGMSCQQPSTAVVVYDESKLSPLVKTSRTFNFANIELVIKQDWGNLGVAAVVWDAAIVLCEFIEKYKEEFKNKEVIELGAGSGIVGIVAALIGANVVITDREQVYPYLKRVLKDNLKDKDNVKYSVKILDWTRDLHKFPQKYDIILGADVIYVEEVFDALLATLQHLSHDETKIYLSCKLRYDRDTRFLDMVQKHFTLQEVLHDKDKDIKIFLCKKIKILS